MEKIEQSKSLLKALDIPFEKEVLITDDSRVKELDQLGEALPKGIIKKRVKVTDEKEVEAFFKLYKSKKELPDNITCQHRLIDGKYVLTCHYKDKYNYYSKENLKSDTVEFYSALKNTESLRSIASTLYFFKILAMIGIGVSVLVFFMFLAYS